MKRTIIKYSTTLLLLLIFHWWLFRFSSFNIPEFIPKTPIPISGLILFTSILTTLIFMLRELYQLSPDISILKLSLYGALICFISESVFQTIKETTIECSLNDHLYYFTFATLGITAYGAILSFLIAFQLKTKKTNWLILFIVFLALVSNFIDRYWIR